MYGPGMALTLTPAARELLHVLQFRADLGPMYAAPAHRGRLAIVVHEMHAVPRLAKVTAVSWGTLNELNTASLVEIDPLMVPIQYTGGWYGDRAAGRRVTLLAAGGAVCPTCGAVGAELCQGRDGHPAPRRHKKRPPVPASA